MSEAEDRDRPPPRRGLFARILRAPVAVAVALYFLLDDVVLAAIRPLVRRLAALRLFARLSDFIHGLGPYPTLFLFAVPFAILEPPKLIGLWLMATGSFRVGLALLVVAHLLSIVLVERLFHVTREKLLAIPWFAWGYGKVIRLRDWALGILTRTEAWQAALRWMAALRERLAALRARLAPGLAALRAAAHDGAARLRDWWKALAAR